MKLLKVILIAGLSLSVVALQAEPHHGGHPGGGFGGDHPGGGFGGGHPGGGFGGDHHGGDFGGGHPGGGFVPPPVEHHEEHHDNHHGGLSDGEAIAIGAVGAAALIGVASMSCSPDVVVKNTTTVEKKLNALSVKELKDNQVFVQKVQDLREMSAKQKVDEAFRMVGIVNPRDAKEIMEVVYAREPSKKSVERVSENLKLSNQQSRLLIQSVTGALKQR